ncbi:autotransporter outer membrane beta-barrel domain-containing protein [Brevundimonas goettingensis]|uniref:Autotransporter outer membrane beta-barrel domain-containing protein n=1 Tax=Brevundimonas goettingensis TaxID=2774190 RepID=A0A975C679_9CAUL|nr:autotransporter outer membrane beta-barrel domain-containing protein [Brevundimonas goettingensis]QTC92730.1 autotransporter outer membrane beta-barrel domain-containing protein [Brevundimonas goettingensis]
MRKLLATAAALAPLMVATGVQAEVVVSTIRTTPIQTSNATGSAADNIRFASGGGTNLSSGTAVTIDSNNTLTVDSGANVNIENAADNAIAVQVNGGVTTTVLINGQVLVADTLTSYPDTDSDGDVDGPWAVGTNRYGVRLSGAGAVTGNIDIGTSGVVQVEGNNSVAVAIDTNLIGNLTNLGTINVFGDNSAAFRTTAAVTGNITLDGTLASSGGNSSAAQILGDVSGRLTIQGALTSSGYRYNAQGTDAFIKGLEPEDLLQTASTVIVGANVAGGVVFDAPPVDLDANNAEEDGDGRLDASEGTANILAYGSAPAVTIGSATQSITLGAAGTTADTAYGFINRGSIVGNGIYDGINGNAVLFGGGAGQTVNVAGGIFNAGTIAVLASEANATSLHLAAGASTPILRNDGFITAASATSATSTVNAIRIDAGASLPSFVNNGSILATSGGGTANIATLVDLSGTLTSIVNTYSFQANLVANADGDPVTGTAVAMDLRANTSGVTITQTGILSATDSVLDDTDNDGVDDVDEPILVGNVLLGSGADTINVQNGTWVGDIAFGAGADALNITGGAVVSGALSDTDGLLNVNVANGTLEARQTSQLNVTGLNVGATGTLLVALDPATSTTAGGFKVNGTANIATGATLGIRFTSLLQSPQRFTLIHADTLNYGTVNSGAVQENSPYLFVVSAGADVAAGDVYIDARRRTASEIGMIGVESQAFDAVYNGLAANSALQSAFLSETTRDGLMNLYEQTLPDHSGGPLLSLASGVDAVTRALTGRNASAGVGETSAWVQEINFYADKDKTDTYGFRSEGFGVAGGVETGTTLGAVGISLAFTSSDIEDPEAEAQEILSASLVELGLYWRAQGQNWTTWARAAAGYATFSADRSLVGDGLYLNNQSDWNGFSLALAGGASYERNFGRLNIRPEIYAEYFGLHEGARTESGGGDGFDLDIDERDGHLLTGVAAVNIGYGFGSNGWIRPEVRLGWRQNLSVDPGETIARFASGGSSFTLDPTNIEGGGPIAGFRLSVGNELGMLTINADAEMLEDYVRYTLLLRASFRF